jgi:hypothetical protein
MLQKDYEVVSLLLDIFAESSDTNGISPLVSKEEDNTNES